MSILSYRLKIGVSAYRTIKKPAGLEGKNWRDLRKRQRFGHDQWRPAKRLTHDQMDHLRNLRQMQPEEWTNKKLSEKFGISVPSVARILKSKFEASPEVRARQDAKAIQQRDHRREKLYQELSTRTKDNRQNVDRQNNKRENDVDS